jgi:DNA-binding PadR family transcriptional regulator
VATERELAPGEWSILALLSEEPSHGWALAQQMARDGEIGNVWSVGRPLVYRALEHLQASGLIEAIGSEPGIRGPNRTIFRATEEGRRALRDWLFEPVEHVRQVRSLFLLKLVLIERTGMELTPLLEAQRARITPAVEHLEERLSESDGTESIFLRFRLETTRAVLFFIDELLDRGGGARSRAPRAIATP